MKSARYVVALSLVFLLGAAQSLFPQAEGGTVRVSFDFARLFLVASNQFAVWIEDDQGRFVKTLAATGFTAKTGYRTRPDSLAEWVKVSTWEEYRAKELDAVSRATPNSGTVSLRWDCRDRNGERVPAGVYVYKVEANNFFAEKVVWTGRIRIGGGADASVAEAAYSPDAKSAVSKGLTVKNVSAGYLPR